MIQFEGAALRVGVMVAGFPLLAVSRKHVVEALWILVFRAPVVEQRPPRTGIRRGVFASMIALANVSELVPETPGRRARRKASAGGNLEPDGSGCAWIGFRRTSLWPFALVVVTLIALMNQPIKWPTDFRRRGVPGEDRARPRGRDSQSRGRPAAYHRPMGRLPDLSRTRDKRYLSTAAAISTDLRSEISTFA